MLMVGSLNPGRTGFIALGTDIVLYWRLCAVAAFMERQGLQICFLPGPRFPPGMFLPPDFPRVYLGGLTTSRAGVGVFIRHELHGAAYVVKDLGCERSLWLAIPGTDSETGVIMCGFCPAPGGGMTTWDRILADYKVARVRY